MDSGDNDMQPQIRRFNTITLRPHWGQYVISQGFMFLVTMLLLLVAGHDIITYKSPFLLLSGFTGSLVLYRSLYLWMIRYYVTSEQLIIKHGVLKRTCDYIELYRIVDFCESRNILEQVFGIKTVSIYSGDRTNPRLDIYGIRERTDVVSVIRERVEYNKRSKGVYEITNR